MAEKAVELKKFIEENTDISEIEKKIGGIPEEWTYLNIEDNLRSVENKENIIYSYIEENLTDYKVIMEAIEKTKNDLIQQGGDIGARSPAFRLFESAYGAQQVLYKILAYMFVWWDIQSIVIENMRLVLREGKKYGYLKQKADIELESLRKISSSLEGLSKLPESITKVLEEIKKTMVESFTSVVQEVLDLAKEKQVPKEYRDKLTELERKVEMLSLRKTEPEVTEMSSEKLDEAIH